MISKIKGLTKKERMAIEEYEELLLEKFPNRLVKLILFGSKARGSSTPFSDIDLLVVVNKNGKQLIREIVSLTHEPIVHFEVELSPIVMEEKAFNDWSPFLSHVKKEGIIIWIKKSKKNM